MKNAGPYQAKDLCAPPRYTVRKANEAAFPTAQPEQQRQRQADVFTCNVNRFISVSNERCVNSGS